MEWVEDSPQPHANFSLPIKNQLRILTHATKFYQKFVVNSFMSRVICTQEV